jgi:hypothetical protein
MFKIYDGRKEFYQWDLDRKLIVNDKTINQVHFCNRTDDCSLVCEVYELDGQRVVNVPNVLLQTDWRINAYGYDSKYTKHSACFNVVKRSKPVDYIYTETELYSVEKAVENATTEINDTLNEHDKLINENSMIIEDLTQADRLLVEEMSNLNNGVDILAEMIAELGKPAQCYEILAETTLTEPARQIKWTKADNGKSLTDYKDFFIYWTGSFTANTSEAFLCNGNDGGMYFAYYFPARGTGARGGWFQIDELLGKEKEVVAYRSLYPSTFLGNVFVERLETQGLAENNRAVSSDLVFRSENPDFTNFIETIIFGTTPTATSMFATGTRAILLGRARKEETEIQPTEKIDYTKYLNINYDGVVSLKPEYQANGVKNAALPETIVIPDVINNIAVSALAEYMFQQNLRVKSITIPNSVVKIPKGFANEAYNLAEIKGTENIEVIGNGGFRKSGIKKALFPKLKAFEGTQQFYCNANLSIVDVGNVVSIPKSCFFGCERLSLVLGGAGLTEVNDKAFFATRNLKNLPIVSNTTYMGAHAFELSRVDFDWWAFKDSGCTFGVDENGVCNATAAHFNPTDWWSRATYQPCENALGSTFNQNNPEWKNIYIPNSSDTYGNGCLEISTAHVYSALTGEKFDSPRYFVETIVGGIDNGSLLVPTTFENGKKKAYSFEDIMKWLTALGLECEKVDNTDYTTTQKLYDALKDGALVITYVNPGHAAVVYGIADNGELLTLDSGAYQNYIGIYEAGTFQQPIWSFMIRTATYVIVKKKG